MIYAIYMRHGVTKKERCASYDDAASRLLWGGDSGELYDIGIVDTDKDIAILPKTVSSLSSHDEHVSALERETASDLTIAGTYHFSDGDSTTIEMKDGYDNPTRWPFVPPIVWV